MVTKRYQGKRATSWWQPATQTNRDPNRDKKLCGATSNGTDQNQTSLLHIESSLDRLGLLSPAHDQRSQQQSGQITPQPVWINKCKFFKATHRTEAHGGGGLKLVKPAREPTFGRPKPCASLKKPHESCPFAAPCGPRRKKITVRGQTSAFPSETSGFAPLILAHRGSALPCLVDDRAALRLRRIWCVPI